MREREREKVCVRACVCKSEEEREREIGFLRLLAEDERVLIFGTKYKGNSVQRKNVCKKGRRKFLVKMSELGALPPGWDTKFDPRTGR